VQKTWYEEPDFNPVHTRQKHPQHINSSSTAEVVENPPSLAREL